MKAEIICEIYDDFISNSQNTAKLLNKQKKTQREREKDRKQTEKGRQRVELLPRYTGRIPMWRRNERYRKRDAYEQKEKQVDRTVRHKNRQTYDEVIKLDEMERERKRHKETVRHENRQT